MQRVIKREIEVIVDVDFSTPFFMIVGKTLYYRFHEKEGEPIVTMVNSDMPYRFEVCYSPMADYHYLNYFKCGKEKYYEEITSKEFYEVLYGGLKNNGLCETV